MTQKTIDISGKVCPYCMLAVHNAVTKMTPSDELVIICDHPPAATTSIPQYAREAGLEIESEKTSPGTWEITLKKR